MVDIPCSIRDNGASPYCWPCDLKPEFWPVPYSPELPAWPVTDQGHVDYNIKIILGYQEVFPVNLSPNNLRTCAGPGEMKSLNRELSNSRKFCRKHFESISFTQKLNIRSILFKYLHIFRVHYCSIIRLVLSKYLLSSNKAVLRWKIPTSFWSMRGLDPSSKNAAMYTTNSYVNFHWFTVDRH